MSLGQKIAEARKNAGLTQPQLAAKIGISLASVQFYEYDKVEISLKKIRRIAAALDLPLSYFIEDEAIDRERSRDNEADQGASGKIGLQDSASIYIGRQNQDVVGALVYVPCLTIKAAAGGGNHLDSISGFDARGAIALDRRLFRTRPPKNLQAIEVEGYSMLPMLLPGSWVIFDADDNSFRQDGLYVLNWRNDLMVKILQIDPQGRLHIKSANKDYESWAVDPDDQSVLIIVGRVVKVIM